MIKQLGMILTWNGTFGGTKRGLQVLTDAVILLNKKQEEIIEEINKLTEAKRRDG